MSDASSSKTTSVATPKHPKKGAFRDIAGAFMLAIGSIVGASFLGGLIIGFAGWDLLNLTPEQTQAMSLWQVAVTGILLLWFVSLRSDASKELGLKKPPARWLITTFKAFGVYAITSTALQIVLSQFVTNLDQEQDLGVNSLQATPSIPITFLTLVVLTPIVEELLFRGLLFNRANRHYSFMFSAVITSIMFGVFHGQLNVAIDAGLMGFFCAWLFYTTKSVYPAIMLHTIKNGLAFYFLFVLPQ